MKRFRIWLAMPLCVAAIAAARAQSTGDPIGLNALRAMDPTLTGSGVIVAQPEAIVSGTEGFEVNPGTVGAPGANLVYIAASGTATSFPNTVGSESGHADSVGDIMYGDTDTSNPEGVAYGVSQIYNYDANYFYNSLIANNVAIPARIVNQSFVFLTGTDTAGQAEVQQGYDWYTAQHNTLFISGIGNGGAVLAPGSDYNGIGVAAYGGSSSTGPTYDGRSKPDITAPAGATSYSTPQVSGAAAILLQAATRGDGGAGTQTAALDARTLKALLLNGAVKPSGWTNSATAPLDPNYGAGILNIYNSYLNLKAGEASVSGSAAGAIQSMSGGTYLPNEGWDLGTISNTGSSRSYVNETNYYEFDLSAATAPAFTLTSTLTWWLHNGQTAINNLDLYLFNADTGALVSLSDSTVDNVQELYVQDLAPGDYDLAVLKNGGASLSQGGSVVSRSETYAIAFNFQPLPGTAAVPEPPAFLLFGAALPFLQLLVRRRQ